MEDAEDALLKVNVCEWTPPGVYRLTVRGMATTGSPIGVDESTLVGERFRAFVLIVH